MIVVIDLNRIEFLIKIEHFLNFDVRRHFAPTHNMKMALKGTLDFKMTKIKSYSAKCMKNNQIVN